MDVDCPPGRPARAAAAKAAAAGTREAAEEEAHAPRSVVPKPAPAAVSEADALAATLGPGEAAAAAGAAYRRLSDFSVCDDAGRPQPLAPSPPPLPFPLLLSGRVLPAAGGAAKGAASSVERLSLASVSFDDATGVVLLSTSAATYTGACASSLLASSDAALHAPPLHAPLVSRHVSPTQTAFTRSRAPAAVKPCAAYKPFFAPATECAAVCGAVMRALSEPSAAPTLEFKEAAARVARSQSITLPAARAMLVAAGPTLLAKMREADARLPAPDRKGKSKAGSAAVLRLCDAPFAVGLREALAEAAREAAAAAAPRAHGAGGIVIRDVAAQPAAPAAPAAAAAADAAAAVPATDESADRAAQAASDAAVAATLAATEASKAGSKARKADAAAAAKAASGSALVAADPSLWVHEHPGPTPYEKHTEEVDELLLGDMDGDAYVSPEDLPRRTLDDFALYTDEGMLASLELLPLWAGVDPDVDLFGSGVVGEDAGDWGDGSEQAEPSGGGAAGGGGSSSDAGGAGGGLRLFLSAVKEWVLECSFDAFSITLRTDAAWYRLKSPSQAYAPFYAPLRKACGVAVACLTMVAGEERAARMTLELLVRKLAELPPSSPLFISSKPAEVERYVASHGAIVLNQFATYPNKEVRKSPLPSQLRACMLSRRHTVAAPAAAGAGGGGKRGGRGKARGAAGERTNLNPVRSVAARAKPMRATQTSLVHRVWAATVAAAEDEARDAAAAAEAAEGAAAAAEEGAAPPDAAALRATAAATAAAGAAAAAVARKPPPLAARAPPPSSASSASAAASAASSKPSWPPGSLGTPLPAGSGVTHPCLLLGGVRVAPGDAVWINDDDASPSAPLLPGAPRPGARLGLVMRLWAPTAPGGHPPPHAAVRLLVHGAETVLRGAAGPSELFLSTRVVAGEVAATLGMVTASPGCEVARRDRPWGFAHRAAAEAEDAAAADAAAAAATLASADAAAAAAPVRYFWRTVWHPSRGAFLTPPPDILCYAAHEAAVATEAAARETRKAPSTGGFFKNGVEYAPGDYVYLLPEAVAPIEPLEASASPEAPAYLKAGRAQKGADQRCRALAVARIVAVSSAPAPAVAPPPPPQAKQSGGGAGAGAGAAAAAAGKKAPGRAAAAAAAAASRATAGDGDGGGASDGEEEEPDWDADDADDAATEEEEGDEGRRRRRAPSRKAAPATAARGRAASASGASFSLRLLRCVRPEELSAAMGYSAGQWEVYASSREIFAPVSAVVGKCCLVAPPESGTNTPLHPADTFICGGTWDFATSSLGPAPPGLAAYTPPPPLDASVKPLPTMDIFAGCGGLSEGMSQAGAAVAKWAIEYEPDAAQAFRDNHPGAAVFNANCNVILRAAMRKAGLPDACVVASPEAEEQAAAVPPDQMALIPVPGEVEFICGGPPCQARSAPFSSRHIPLIFFFFFHRSHSPPPSSSPPTARASPA